MKVFINFAMRSMLILFFASAVQASEASSIFNEIPRLRPAAQMPEAEVLYGSVHGADQTLRRVIVTKPPGAGPFAAVLFIGGIGCYSLDETVAQTPPAYLSVIKEIARVQMVSLRVEKSAMGDSEGSACEKESFQGELSNYRAGLKYLKSLSFVDPQKIIIIGHSMGGVFGPMVAAENPVLGLIQIATLGQDWLSYEKENTRRQLELAGTSSPDIEVWMQKLQQFHDLFHHQNLSFSQIIAQHPDLEVFTRFPMSEDYLRELVKLDILAPWRKVSGKTLLIHGQADYVSSAADHEKIAMTVNTEGHGRAQHVEFPLLDHYFWMSKDEAESFRFASVGGKGAVYNSSFFTQLGDAAKAMR